MKRRRYLGVGRSREGRSDLVFRTFLLRSLSQGEVFLYNMYVEEAKKTTVHRGIP